MNGNPRALGMWLAVEALDVMAFAVSSVDLNYSHFVQEPKRCNIAGLIRAGTTCI